MLKIRKVMNFFYRFRFVFIGVAVVTTATITTLDLTKGNITEVSKFEVSYNYGDPISYSGTAFMGNVTFEFRRKGDKEWTEEEPYLAGEYEARGKSQGSHGYKYTEISSFEIKPLNLSLDLLSTSINFGEDHPDVTYDHNSLAKGDKLLEKEITVKYADLESRTTTANFDMNTIKVEDDRGRDVTSCYVIDVKKDIEITFNKEVIEIEFVQKDPFEYTGEVFSNNEYVVKNGHLFYGAELIPSGGKSGSAIGVYDNTGQHSFKVMDAEGHDYSDNYDIRINENSFEVEAGPFVTISSKSLRKTYDGKPFEDFNDLESLITVSPRLIKGHKLKIISFDNTSVYKSTADLGSQMYNTFTFDIVDEATETSVDRTLYKGITPVYGTIDIDKRPITITSESDTFDFDGQNHSNPTVKSIGGMGLGAGDQIIVNSSTEQLAPTYTGGVDNTLDYTIKHGEEDVTDCYDVSGKEYWGKLVVNHMKLKFNFETFPVTYDGQNHPLYKAYGNYDIYDTEEKRENAAVLADGYSLPAGWTYDVHLRSSSERYRKYYKESGYTVTGSDVEMNIWDDHGNNLTHCFDINDDITFNLPYVNITPKPLQITVEDYNKTFDNEILRDTCVINPSDPNTCVTYSGLVTGDEPDVKFANQTIPNNKDVSDTPYTLSLTYGVNNSSGTNITTSYDISFTNNKKTINATITKKDINIIPKNIDKIYDGSTVFTPEIYDWEAKTTPLIGSEEVSLNIKDANSYTTTDSKIGTYSYSLKESDVKIMLNGVDETKNYNIFFKNSGSVEISSRPLNISSTSSSNAGSFIFYDNSDHGAYTFGNGYRNPTYNVGGQSSEINIELQHENNTRGLAIGHRLVIDDSDSLEAYLKKKDPGSLLIGQHDDLGIVVYDSNNLPVTSNYTITHDPFYINIVKPKIYISPKTCSKIFDGSYFEQEGLENVPFTGDNAYRNYDSTEMKLLYNCSFTYDLNDGYGERDYTSYMTQRGHTLKITKYTQECANNAVYYYPANAPLDYYGNPETYNAYPFNYLYKVFDSNGNDVTNLYTFDAPQGLEKLMVQQASVSISCTGGTKIYNGQVCDAPADQYPITDNNLNSAYIVASSSSVGPKFNNRYQLRATFNTGSYTEEQIALMYLVGTYNFSVTIKIHDLNTSMQYADDGVPSIKINIIKNYYEYEVVETTVTITTTKVLSNGKSIRKASGLADGDKVYFYDEYGEEELVSGLHEYTKPVNQVRVYRGNNTTGRNVTSCYHYNLPTP